MTDIVDSKTRSRMMSGIRGANTKPERIVRIVLHSLGFRFRLHSKKLPGRPDIVLPKYRAVILVHGCFWHGHDCPYFKLPTTRPDFWLNKIITNQDNDILAIEKLVAGNWRVATIWECALKGKNRIENEVLGKQLAHWITSDVATLELRGER